MSGHAWYLKLAASIFAAGGAAAMITDRLHLSQHPGGDILFILAGLALQLGVTWVRE